MQRSVRNLALVLVGLLCLFSFPSHAYELGEYLSINGFLSQGYINSTGNNVFGDSLDGSFELNEFALTLNSVPTEKLRLSVQLLSRDLGEEGNNRILVDWAMVDYRLTDSFGVRLGKVKLPFGLYNQQRDSDFLRPMAFLPQSVYNENKRSLLVGAVGGSIYGSLSLDAIGDFDYQAYYGQVDFHNDSGQARGMESLIKKIAMQGSLGPVNNFDAENDYVYGGSLIYYPHIDGLRLGISYFTGGSEFNFTVGGNPGTAEGNNENLFVFSAEYSGSNWTLVSEYTEFTGDRKIMGNDIPDGRSQGGYLQFCYHLSESVAVSALYDIFYVDKDDRDGDKFSSQNQPDYLAWRKDLGTAIRWDITEQWMVRAEYHNLDGAALQLSIFNPQGVERYWSYYVLKTSFNF